ncbi:MAG: DUF2029 domain-containing protein [Alphaproteobacteria bacterium]|nr:DUF2029 domain-containing protein [Alphaproteobacteria bacterium]
MCWRPGDGKFRLLAAALLLLVALYDCSFATVQIGRLRGGDLGDFFALWSTGRFAATHAAASVYDPAALHAGQVALGMDPQGTYPFPYPPSLLLLLWPLAWLPPLPAYSIAMGGSLALFVWAVAGPGWRMPVVLGALLAPVTAITLVAGQLGCLAGALLVGGLRLAQCRPVLAGCFFGLLSYKPQMGVLLPLALLSAQSWRCLASVAFTIAVLGIASTAAFGLDIWPAWFAALPRYAAQFEAESDLLRHFMPTIYPALMQAGTDSTVAMSVQLAATLVVVCVTWRLFRRGVTRLAAAGLIIATFLAVPHAFVYDMPAVAAAVLWTVAEAADTNAPPFATSEVLIMVLLLVAPIALVPGTGAMPLAPISLALMLWLIERRSPRLPG